MQLQLAFVESILPSPTVRLDLTAAPWAAQSSSRFDPPPLRQAVTETLLADGGPPRASAYSNRTIELRLKLFGVTEDQAAQQVAALARELDRSSNLLMYRPGTSVPQFFRTYRAGPEAIDFDAARKEVSVEILADSFGYGVQETLPQVGVPNNPSAAGGMVLDVTGVKGDVETPLHLVVFGPVSGTGRLRSGLAVRRRGTPSATPLVLQAESMTQGTDTSVLAGSATVVSGGQYSQITFTTQPGLTQRLSTSKFPSAASEDARGTYRVFARVRQNTPADSILVRLRWGGADVPISNSNVTVPTSAQFRYVDLGLIQIPVGYDPVTRGPSGLGISTEGVFLALDARRVTGTGTLDVDVLLLWPCDDRSQYVLWPEAGTGISNFWLEGGPAPQAYARSGLGQIVSTQPIEIAGGGLMVSPGVTNRVFFARDLGRTATAGDDISATTQIIPVYWPRYLRPATS